MVKVTYEAKMYFCEQLDVIRFKVVGLGKNELAALKDARRQARNAQKLLSFNLTRKSAENV